MTADLTPSLDALIDNAKDRDELLALLQTEQPEPAQPLAEPGVKSVKPGAKSVKWTVVRQFNHLPERQVCGHRFELLAELCAYRLTRRHAHETGGHYTVRRAER